MIYFVDNWNCVAFYVLYIINSVRLPLTPKIHQGIVKSTLSGLQIYGSFMNWKKSVFYGLEWLVYRVKLRFFFQKYFIKKEKTFLNSHYRLRKLESEFYSLVSVSKTSRELKLPKEVARKLLSYWTMKRRVKINTRYLNASFVWVAQVTDIVKKEFFC